MQSAEDGDYVEWRDYKRVLNEIELLNGTVKYWEIEARTDHDRWLRVLEDYERLKEKSTCQAECLDAFDVKLSQAEAEISRLKAEVERLRKACELVFDESAKRKFLMCYRGNDFYVSKEAMEAMSVALGYSKAKEGKQS